MSVLSSLVLAAALAASVSPQTPVPPDYSVAVAITDDGKLVGAQSLTLERGGSGTIESPGVYRVEASLTKTSASRLQLKATISRPQARGWVVVSRPTITLEDGAQAMTRTSGADWDTIEVVVKPKERAPS